MNEYSGMTIFCFLICCYLMSQDGDIENRIKALEARVTALELKIGTCLIKEN